MFVDQSFVIKGALAAYSVSYYEVGRLSAKYVQRILADVKPKDLPVQQVDKIELVINLKTAKALKEQVVTLFLGTSYNHSHRGTF
jgi:putative tryptophan/tyrosine transport system substrate-binding protein